MIPVSKPHSMAAPDRATLVAKAKNWLAWLEGAGDKPLTTTESLMLALGEFAEAVVDLEEQLEAMREALVAFAFAQEWDANGNEYYVHGKRTREMAEAVLVRCGSIPAMRSES